MGAFVFRFPQTGLNVQGWTASETVERADVYETVQCLACGAVHLVKPSSGKVIVASGNDGKR